MELEQAVTGYFDTRKRLEKAWGKPLQLSDVMLKMSTYLSYIGDHLGELKAKYETDRATAYMQYLQEGKSASNSENLARVDTSETRGQGNKLELTLKNGQNLVSVGQSRLRVLDQGGRNQI